MGRRAGLIRTMIVAGVLVLAAAAAAAPALAQAAATPPAAPVLTPEQQNEARRIEGLLMCPVCKGQTVQESNSEVAREIKVKIRQMLAEGKSRQEILDHFAAEYGDWILSQPPVRGAGLVAWLAPALLLLLGAGVLAWFFRRQEPGPGPGGQGAPSGPGGSGSGQGVDPEVRRKIDDRLKDYL